MKVIFALGLLVILAQAGLWGDSIESCAIEVMSELTSGKGVAFDECQSEGACCKYNHQCATHCCEFDACRGVDEEYDWDTCENGNFTPETEFMTC